VTLKIFTCEGGTVDLPDPQFVLISRENGGNLIVHPPRPVWERSELTRTELMLWAFLVAATGRAMLDVLPQLKGGCINYWEAGNWALNDDAEPKGRKLPSDYRRVHLHLLGRSPVSTDPSCRWGESPNFPDYADRLTWSADKRLFTPEECRAILHRTERLLTEKYDFTPTQIGAWSVPESA